MQLKRILPFYAIILFIGISSCKKHCPNPSQELGYIRGSIGSQFFNLTERPNISDPDGDNAYYYGSNLNQINLIRLDKYDQTRQGFEVSIFINGIQLDTMPIPTDFDPAKPYVAYADVQIMDSTYKDEKDLYVAGGENLLLRISDKTNDVITGTFDAKLKNQRGQTKHITNGEFRIKVFRKKQDE